MASIRDLRATLADFKASPEGFGHQLRMTLADVVLDGLRARGWTQRHLARQAGKDEAYITRVVHGDQNCSLDTIGELLHALGIKASIVPDERLERFSFADLTLSSQSDTYAREEVQVTEAATAVGAGRYVRAEGQAG